MMSPILAALIAPGVFRTCDRRSGCKPVRPAGLLHHVHADADLRPGRLEADRGRHPRRRRQHAAALGRRGVPLEEVPDHLGVQREHENVRQDFVRDLIDHAHTRGIKVLLGFTPFGYDGVNQYPLEHPETRAVGKDGKPVGTAASAAGATTSARRGPSRSGSCSNTSGRWPSTSTRTPTGC